MQTKFHTNGIPTIKNGHMAAPSLLYVIEYGIFRRTTTGKFPRERAKKWKTIFRGSF
jgi:hypothetical protein